MQKNHLLEDKIFETSQVREPNEKKKTKSEERLKTYSHNQSNNILIIRIPIGDKKKERGRKVYLTQ